MKTILVLPVLLAGSVAMQDPVPEKSVAQHRWLQQLVGDWTCKIEASMGEGAPPVQMESTEHCRAFGATWIVAEGDAQQDQQPFRSMLTLGYDVAAKAFVGTWIDTMQTHLWVYRGSLDDAQKVLTLEAEGPAFGDPSKTALYRDAIEIVGPDHKRLTSSVRGDDGKWVRFLTAEYRRKK